MKSGLDHVNKDDYPGIFLDNLQNPERIWLHAFNNQLSEAARNFLIVLYSLNSQSPMDNLKNSFIKMTGSSPRDFNVSLEYLENSFICHNKERLYSWRFDSEYIKVEFQNPSIRDFIKNHINKNNEYVEFILDKGLFFLQLAVLWGSPFGVNNPPSTRQNLINSKIKFIAALQRLLLAEYNNKFSYEIKDTPLEIRAFILFDIFRVTNFKQVGDLFVGLVDSITKENVNDKSILLKLLKEIKNSNSLFNEYFSNLFTKAYFIFLNDIDNLWDCVCITEYCDVFDEFLSLDQKEEFKKIIIDYTFDRDELSSLDSTEELQEYGEHAEKISNFWDVSFDYILSSIDDRIEELENKKNKQTDDQDNFNDWGGGSFGKPTSDYLTDDYISKMFDTLNIERIDT